MTVVIYTKKKVKHIHVFLNGSIGTTFIGCPTVADDIALILYHPEDLQHALHIVRNETRRDKVTIKK
jgi:hypothetical protein